MKTFITLGTILFIALFTQAQYQSTLDESHTWNIRQYGLIVNDYVQYFNGEQEIDGETYSVLWQEYQDYPAFEFAWLREDEMEQRIYLRQQNQDYLLCDFTVASGDTLSVYGVGMLHLVTITNVEETTIAGALHTVVTFTEDTGATGQWIEGIGSLYGPSDGALGLIMDFFPQVTCFYSGTQLDWFNPSIPDLECETPNAVVEPEIFEVNIFPNPTTDYVQLQAKRGDVIQNLSIYDHMGKRVFATNYVTGIISLEALPAGIYILHISNSKGEIYKKELCITGSKS